MAPAGTFYKRFKKKNKLGGQYKVPKVMNDRNVLDDLLPLLHE